jgi:hypothetical protein
MAVFPSLQPSSRAWTPGVFGVSATQALSGAQIRVSHTSVRFGDQLQLVFANRSESDSLAITNHYNGQSGNRDSFSLPSAVFAGLSNSSSITSPGNRWIYRRAPQVAHNAPDIHTITVDLEQVVE